MFTPLEQKTLDYFKTHLTQYFFSAKPELCPEICSLYKDIDDLALIMYSSMQIISVIYEIKDPYTWGHQLRTAMLAVSIAEKLKDMMPDKYGQLITEEFIVRLFIAARLHDVGKIAIPSELLVKPTKLTDQEFALIKTHTQYGRTIVSKIHFPWNIEDIIYQHHERLDGSGYPDKLVGDQILFPTKILSVADVIEAMSSPRPYRLPYGIDKALSEIKQESGTLLCPDCVIAATELFTKDGYLIS